MIIPDWIMQNLLWTEGAIFLLVLACFGIASFLWCRKALYLVGLLFVFLFYFFRNPVRVCPQARYDTSIIVCPADGRVVEIRKNADLYFYWRVSIFLSPFDVHVNWIPTEGTVLDTFYHSGTFIPAFVPKSSEHNERNDVLLYRPDGILIKVTQIAGIIARRIVCWVKKGDRVKTGEKFGMIKFGSRVDIWLPPSVHIEVRKDQKVFGGQTVLGRII